MTAIQRLSTPGSPSNGDMSTDSEVEALLQRIAGEFSGLSRQLKVIARYVEQHHEHLALDRIQDVATRCGAQPSAVVRFAKRFGFSGYNGLKRAFRDDAGAASGESRDYRSRLRAAGGPATTLLSSADIAFDFIDEALDGMRLLRRDGLGAPLDHAVGLLAAANTLWVAGARRSHPVATHLAYALQHTDKPVQLLAHLGAMHEGQVRGLRPGDALLAVAFAPYAAETVLAVQLARQHDGSGARPVHRTRIPARAGFGRHPYPRHHCLGPARRGAHRESLMERFKIGVIGISGR